MKVLSFPKNIKRTYKYFFHFKSELTSNLFFKQVEINKLFVTK